MLVVPEARVGVAVFLRSRVLNRVFLFVVVFVRNFRCSLVRIVAGVGLYGIVFRRRLTVVVRLPPVCGDVAEKRKRALWIGIIASFGAFAFRHLHGRLKKV